MLENFYHSPALSSYYFLLLKLIGKLTRTLCTAGFNLT